jgi:phage shock protein PspC (stress-responsive transcriptional regulator)
MRLHRGATDRVVLGVCGGLAESLEVDPSLVRLAFVVGTLWGGLGLLVYLILGIVLPVGASTSIATRYRPGRTGNLAGLVLVVLGALPPAGNVGWAPWLTWNLFWPGVLIAIGLALLLRGAHEAPTRDSL